MRQRPLPLHEDPDRWILLERSDVKAVLARGRRHMAIFREGQEITVLLCAPDWTLTPHGIVEGTAGITLFPRALPPTAAPRTSSPPRPGSPRAPRAAPPRS